MPDTAPLIKEVGEPKEHHEARLGAALPLIDVHAYVDDFNASIVGAYRRGVADAEMPADVGLARSIIPPGTAATRDFSRLAPRIPAFAAERCVGCRLCQLICSYIRFKVFNPSRALIRVSPDERRGTFAVAFLPECTGCGACTKYCPNQALIKAVPSPEAENING